MSKIAYLECPTGIAGDMLLGALVHAGVPLDYLRDHLAKLGIAEEFHLWAEPVLRNGQQATKVHVDLTADLSAGRITTTFATTPQNPSSHAQKHSEQHSQTHSHQPHSHKQIHQPGHSHDHHHEPDHERDQQPHSHEQIHQPGHSHDHHHEHSHDHHHEHSYDHDHEHSHDHGTRHLPEIEQMILAAGLPAWVETASLTIFRQLAVAEGSVHGIPPEQVHFHEVGATDAIVDIVGSCLGLNWLGIEAIYCSALPTGGGTIRAAHGLLPVPTPAVLKLYQIRQVPVYSNGIQRELVTPTGAAIATTLAHQFGAPPPMILQQIGLGAGSQNLPLPNMVRLWLGELQLESHGTFHGTSQLEFKQELSQELPSQQRPESQGESQNECQSESQNASQQSASLGKAEGKIGRMSIPPTSGETEVIAHLETQIDDLNPQVFGYLFDQLLQAGALDVFTQALGMKKSRPGILLSVICDPDQIATCEAILFRETTTLGIRRSLQQRTVLRRDWQSVTTSYGDIRIKIARQIDGSIVNVQPEYEDCVAIAQQQQRPWQEIHRLALQHWYKQSG